jgi:hypothetical protein
LGVTIFIPPGAATDEVSIDISEIIALPVAAPTNTWQAGRIISLISNVKNFLIPITITMPLFAGAKSPEMYFLDGSLWSQSGLTFISLDNSSITFTSNHLTTFVPFAQAQAIQYTFGPNPFDPYKDGTAYFWYWLTNVKNTQLVLFDMSGNLLLKRDFLAGANGAQGGANSVAWDGKNNYGEVLASGLYLYQIVQDGKLISRGKVAILRR